MTRSGSAIQGATTRPVQYADLQRALAGLLAGEPDFIANAANFAALVYHSLPDLNWAGCYFLRGQELVLGPFQGRPACVRIAMGRGVCGTAAQQRASVVVADVHEFPDHIVCDPVSRSELVVPLIKDSELVGVFDLDSPLPGRFNEEDRAGMEIAVRTLMAAYRPS
ncbi:MAG TPA: GAF domain-containing protein [Steroidobacteraceae bacterium]|nr:GAF domain-containing protein [Steroidobacteraceae bacterium]